VVYVTTPAPTIFLFFLWTMVRPVCPLVPAPGGFARNNDVPYPIAPADSSARRVCRFSPIGEPWFFLNILSPPGPRLVTLRQRWSRASWGILRIFFQGVTWTLLWIIRLLPPPTGEPVDCFGTSPEPPPPTHPHRQISRLMKKGILLTRFPHSRSRPHFPIQGPVSNSRTVNSVLLSLRRRDHVILCPGVMGRNHHPFNCRRCVSPFVACWRSCRVSAPLFPNAPEGTPGTCGFV